MPQVAFWFDFASTYAYLSAMRIAPLAQAAGVTVAWRPFLLGPIFRAQGWQTSPFNLYPAKGRYMIRDIERIAAARGLVFHMPQTFPANSLLAARVTLVADELGIAPTVAGALFHAQFAEGADIADRAVIGTCLARANTDPAEIFQRAEEPSIKQRLRDLTTAAADTGIFGSPTFVTTDGELFWGDDRLEQALAWARRS